MPLVRHNLFNIIDIVVFPKAENPFLGHEKINRNGLVNETCCRIGIIRGHHNNHAVMFRKIPNRRGNIGALTDDDAIRPVIQSRELTLRTISQNHDVMRLNIVVHHLRIRCRNHNLSFFTKALNISRNTGSFQCFQNILKLCFGCGNHGGVVNVHVRLCNIRNGDESLQNAFLRDCRKSHDMTVSHNLIRLL